jgi:chemotaxis methyl-accepting protein methylase
MAEEQQEPTAEAIKQRKKREKEAAKNAVLGIEIFTVEVAGVLKPDLKRVMAAHGINNQQEVYQLLLMNLIATDFETAALMLKCVTTPFFVSEKVSRLIEEAGMKSLTVDPPEPDDEIVASR